MRKSDAFAWTLLALGVAVVALPLLTALPWLFWPLRAGNPLEYPDHVRFDQTPDEDYTRASWSAEDWDKPGPCPLTVHLPTGDLEAAVLASPDMLRGDGWTEEVTENPPGRVTAVTKKYQDDVLNCTYRGGRIVYVALNAKAASARGVGPVGMSIAGKRVNLPASAAAIEQVLGPPLPKK